MAHDRNQDDLIAYIKGDLDSLKKDLEASRKELREYVDMVLGSMNNSVKVWLNTADERYAKYEDLRPIKKLYDRLVEFSIGLMIVIGIGVISACVFFKDFVIKFLHIEK